MSIASKILAGALSAAALSACVGAGGASVQIMDRSGSYNREELGYGFGGRDLAVEAKGQALGRSAAELAALAAATLRAMPLPVATNPTANPGPSARRLYHVGYDFAPGRTQSSDAVCSAAAAPDPYPADGVVRIYAALCRGTSALTAAFAEVPARDVADPAFQATLYRLSREVLPPAPSSFSGIGAGWRRGF